MRLSLHSDYALRILFMSALISVITAAMLFLAVRQLMVLPIRRVVCRVVDGLETDPVAGGEIASGDALRSLFGDAQALGFGQSAAA